MAIMNMEIYDALKEAGASEEKAKAAAVSVASYDERFAKVESTLRLHSWMLTYLVAVTTASLFRIFS